MSYQAIFDRVYQEKKEKVEDANDYSLMLWGLEAVLQEAGYDFSADYLASRWHNIVSNAHRLTDLEEITKSIFGWTLSLVKQSRFSNQDGVIGGELRYDWLLNKSLRIDPSLKELWEKDLAEAIKKKGTRYGTKKYNSLVEDNAEKVYNRIFRVLETKLEDWKEEVRDLEKTWEIENLAALKNAEDYRRLATLLDALSEITGLDTQEESKEWLYNRANLLEEGVEIRRNRVNRVLYKQVEEEDVQAVVINSRILDFVNYYLTN